MKKYLVGGLCLLFLSSCNYFSKKIEDLVKDKSATAPVQSPALLPPTTPQIVVTESAPQAQATSSASLPESKGTSGISTEEINAYVHCLNRTAERVKQSNDRYLSWVNEKSGPTCTETYISYGLYTLYPDGVETCQKAAQNGQPGSPLQKSASDLAAAYAELVPLVQKAEDYYKQQDYKDDHCAKGKQMHSQLLAAFGRYQVAQNTLETALKPIKDQLDQQELAQMEKTQGKKLAWYSKAFMMSAEKIIRSFPKDEKSPFSSVNYLADYPELEKNYQALADYSAANSQEGKDTFWYSSFESSAKEFYTKAKFLKRDLAEGKKADPRLMNDVIDSYNRLARDSNNLKFKM